jgi:hypothetical protein
MSAPNARRRRLRATNRTLARLLKGLQQARLVDPAVDVQRLAQRVQVEMVMVSSVIDRRIRAAVTEAPLWKRVQPLAQAVLLVQPALPRQVLRQLALRAGDVVGEPVHERFVGRRIGILDQQRERRRLLPRVGPAQRRRHIPAFAGVLERDFAAILERGTFQLHDGLLCRRYSLIPLS